MENFEPWRELRARLLANIHEEWKDKKLLDPSWEDDLFDVDITDLVNFPPTRPWGDICQRLYSFDTRQREQILKPQDGHFIARKLLGY